MINVKVLKEFVNENEGKASSNLKSILSEKYKGIELALAYYFSESLSDEAALILDSAGVDLSSEDSLEYLNFETMDFFITYLEKTITLEGLIQIHQIGLNKKEEAIQHLAIEKLELLDELQSFKAKFNNKDSKLTVRDNEKQLFIDHFNPSFDLNSMDKVLNTLNQLEQDPDQTEQVFQVIAKKQKVSLYSLHPEVEDKVLVKRRSFLASKSLFGAVMLIAASNTIMANQSYATDTHQFSEYSQADKRQILVDRVQSKIMHLALDHFSMSYKVEKGSVILIWHDIDGDKQITQKQVPSYIKLKPTHAKEIQQEAIKKMIECIQNAFNENSGPYMSFFNLAGQINDEAHLNESVDRIAKQTTRLVLDQTYFIYFAHPAEKTQHEMEVDGALQSDKKIAGIPYSSIPDDPNNR
jgi:predicted nucleic acid-binding OB-fold protein